jgi:histidine triad (HIT) family protein
MSCQYCKNLEGSVASTPIHFDELGCAYAEINSGSAVHVLIAPRDNAPLLTDTDLRNPGALSHMLQMAAKIARARRLSGDYRIVVNTGEGGAFSVDHLHVHLLGHRQNHDSLPWPALAHLTAGIARNAKHAGNPVLMG